LALGWNYTQILDHWLNGKRIDNKMIAGAGRFVSNARRSAHRLLPLATLPVPSCTSDSVAGGRLSLIAD